jgi:hypothetical protein
MILKEPGPLFRLIPIRATLSGSIKLFIGIPLVRKDAMYGGKTVNTQIVSEL